MEYLLKVEIEVEAVDSMTSSSWGGGLLTTRDYAGAAGTYVEVESVGVCEFNAGSHAGESSAGNLPDQAMFPDATSQFRLPLTGRPIVLLAVGGGDQVFDHWEGDKAIRDQGARCEIPEPEGRADGFVIEPALAEWFSDVYAKAVFRRQGALPDPRMHEFREGEIDLQHVRPPPRPGG